MLSLSITLLLVISCCTAEDTVEMTYEKTKEELTYEIFCNDDNVCVKVSHTAIMASFKNFFMTEKQMKERKAMMKMGRNIFLKKQGLLNTTSDDQLVGDGDTCCPTAVESVVPVSLVDIFGQLRPIVHLTNLNPPQYQFVSQGKCVGTGKCSGKCLIEPTIITLLIYDYNIKNIAFSAFQVPGYCSCKNIK